MTQPKLPPLSVRLPVDLVMQIDTYATAKGLKRNGAIAELLRKGLEVTAVATPEPVAEKVVKLPPATRPAFKSRLKGEWSPPGKR